MPYLNPARSLGPSFVLNKWDNHWVYWLGPMVGGAVSGLLHEFIFCPKRSLSRSKDDADSSLNSEDDINYDMDLEKPAHQQGKYHQYRAPSGTLSGSQQRYCQSIYTAEPTSKVERVESIYGGTKSMYCKSPPLTRANLNRSQSVYAKSNTALNRDLPARSGPLVPAQSLYPLRVTAPQTHLQNQNVQNQLQQRSDSIYGIRGSMRQPVGPSDRMPQPMPSHPPVGGTVEQQGFQPIYGTRNNPHCSTDALKFDRDPNSRDDALNSKFARGTGGNRPESMYGGPRRIHSAQSDDSSYGSYHGPGPALTPPTRNTSNSSSTFNPTMATLPQPSYERKTSSSSSATHQQQKHQQQQLQQHQQQPQPPRSLQNSSSIQNTSLPPPPLHHTMAYTMHPVRQN
ncbi:neurogenic protein big brain-like [Anopheles bellator]|uniref:neurogenic protein big brain-like n=1 Tax=Anopheles bellator TaxID=139047 RepID=UPI0026487613|nr:neurogenic protein big brain-like [Anopheles bellator]